jgi:cystathionine gamma-synthase
METLAMRDLLADPLWKPEHLGQPIPVSEHAVSVCLPTWQHVVGYEEQDPDVTGAMHCGYPRFFYHPKVLELCELARRQFGKDNEDCLVFPSRSAAERCVRYVHGIHGRAGRIHSLDHHQVHAVFIDPEHMGSAKNYWRFSGDIVSSRLAAAIVDPDASGSIGNEDPTVVKKIRERISHCTGRPSDDVYLFPSGMASISMIHRMVLDTVGTLPTLQLEFPYVDLLKVQQELGPGVEFFPDLNTGQYRKLESLVKDGKFAAAFSEQPGNPLLRSVDLEKLAALLQGRNIPLIVDDTISTNINVDVYPYADAVTTSLTKYFSGVGDVIAGSIVLNRTSPFYSRFQEYLEQHYEDLFWHQDAGVLEKESRDYPERVGKINRVARSVFEWLQTHPLVGKVWYPMSERPDEYEKSMRPGAGYGGLMSLLLKDPEKNTIPFFNSLRLCKGPSLGTNYTLACPFMLLAHYDELDWTDSLGISRYLLRLSIGLEDPEDLIERFERSFHVIS